MALTMRWVPVALAAVLGVCGCGAGSEDGPPVGCGMVGQRALTGLLGTGAVSVSHGSLQALRDTGKPASCTTTSSGDGGARFVAVRAVRHPRPLHLPENACNAGWVYAGTPEKYAPACQETTRRGSRTVLLARWGEYVVRVTIGRQNRNWAGDPEVALAMTEEVARQLGVPVPGQSASGSSS